MQPRRFIREDSRNDSCETSFPVLASETGRSASHRQPRTEPAKGSEERVSIFWRVCGGTILSISALVLITAYQSISSSIHELRNDVARANEARAELVKKDEYSAARTKLWDRLQDMQKEQQTALAPVAQTQQRVDKLEEATRNEATELRETHDLHATIKERLAQFEQQLNNGKLTQKDVQVLQQIVAGLQEKAILRDQQLQQSQEERKDFIKEIQSLRERIAKLEAGKPAPTSKIEN